jgi:F-type H+-transporting ATPase subunit delta
MIRRFSRPYARAIMDVTGSPQVAEALRVELMRFESVRKGSSDLQELYANPGIEAAAKVAITATIAKRLGLTDLAVKVLEVLLRNHRVNDLDGILAALAARINLATGTLVAEVRTAHQLTPLEIQTLQSTLEQKFAKRIELQLATDPDLLAGFVAKVGSEIYDASVAGKIAKFRASLS